MMHPQVETGLGFTCDMGILPFVQAFYRIGFKTLSSCQEIFLQDPSYPITRVSRPRPKGFPRRWIAYTHDDPALIFDLASHIRAAMPADGWSQGLIVDHQEPVIYGVLEFAPTVDGQIMTAIGTFK